MVVSVCGATVSSKTKCMAHDAITQMKGPHDGLIILKNDDGSPHSIEIFNSDNK